MTIYSSDDDDSGGAFTLYHHSTANTNNTVVETESVVCTGNNNESKSNTTSKQQHSSSNTVSVSKVGLKYQSIFKFSHFNRMQSECFHDAFNTDSNLLVSGKRYSQYYTMFHMCVSHSSLSYSTDWNRKDCINGIVYCEKASE